MAKSTKVKTIDPEAVEKWLEKAKALEEEIRYLESDHIAFGVHGGSDENVGVLLLEAREKISRARHVAGENWLGEEEWDTRMMADF